MHLSRPDPPPRPTAPKAKGEHSEKRVIAALLEHGYEVLIAPYSDSLRYDLVLDLGDRFARVQVKSGRLRKGVIQFATASFHGLGERRRRVDYQGQCELFAIFCPDTNRVYLVPVDACGGAEIRLRVEPTRNGQAVGVRWAVDYELRPISA